MRHLTLPAFALLLVAACSGGTDDPATDAGTNTGTDAGTNTDTDAGDEEHDAGHTTGPTVPLEGFGAITGDCGVLDTELTDSSTHVFRNAIDFGTNQYDPEDRTELVFDSQRMLGTENAGGSSMMSEVFSLDVLARCELAKLLKTETEITYATQGKITDYLAEVDGLKIGVSVTRAMTYPRTNTYTLDAAKALLTKKLTAINDSSKNVAAADKWEKQVLSVLADTTQHADVFEQAWNAADATAKADTILFITVTEGADNPIYGN